MFFGRRKHAAPAQVEAAASASPAAYPELTDEMIFGAVQRTMQAVFGDDGEWTVARRSDEQTDQIFHEVLVHSLATAVTASVVEARGTRVSADGAVAAAVDAAPADDALAGGPLGLLRAPRANPWLSSAPVSDADSMGIDTSDEPAAFSWEPAPITRWADLKRPVTGPVAVIEAAATTSEEKAA